MLLFDDNRVLRDCQRLPFLRSLLLEVWWDGPLDTSEISVFLLRCSGGEAEMTSDIARTHLEVDPKWVFGKLVAMVFVPVLAMWNDVLQVTHQFLEPIQGAL